jgi:hypothetical protein
VVHALAARLCHRSRPRAGAIRANRRNFRLTPMGGIPAFAVNRVSGMQQWGSGSR